MCVVIFIVSCVLAVALHIGSLFIRYDIKNIAQQRLYTAGDILSCFLLVSLACLQLFKIVYDWSTVIYDARFAA
jgi:hypothetical protein